MSLPRWLPRGDRLPEHIWALRHRWVVVLLAAQTAGLPAFAMIRGETLRHALLEAVAPLLLVALACWTRLGRGIRSATAATGLMVVSGIVVHLSGGAIEAHFHFFAMIPIVALYQSWPAFGLATGYVLVQHGVVGTLYSHSVYNHSAARERPWVWAAIHAGLFAAACVGALVNWKLHEVAGDVAVDLRRQAHHDPLTGLPNRTVFQQRTEQALAAARTDQPTVLLLDLDGFKDVNDTLGHHHGDLLLIEVGRRLRRCVRAEDTVCRLGGDEFAVLLSYAQPGSGERAAERVNAALTAPFMIEGTTLDLEVSIGIATAQPGEDALALLRHADAAMYVAKEHKLGSTRYAPNSGNDTVARFELLGDLRRALDSDEIVLHYQPIVDTTTGGVISVEALARWQHPTRGLLGPAEFIPVVESTTLIRRFTSHVLAASLAQARQWADAGLELAVSVNVSTRCLLDPEFPATVAAELRSSGVPGALLCVEITEDTVMAGPQRAIDALRQIRALGVRVAIDDFGTGYSSLSYLKLLPVDALKIDRSFVSDLAVDPSDTVLVRSVVDLARNLGLAVVAEGVEDAGVLSVLRLLGCGAAQGYHFARPMPADQIPAWYAESVAVRAPVGSASG